MSEINARWQRTHDNLLRQTGAGAGGAVILWTVSFYASMPAAFGASVHEGWFAFASIVTFVGAVGLTIGAGIGVSALLSDDRPLDGANG